MTPKWRWHIHLCLHQIWTWSEKCAIALEQFPDLVCRKSLGFWLTLAVWLHMTSAQGRDYQRSFVWLAHLGLKCKGHNTSVFWIIARCEKTLKKWTFRMLQITKTLHWIIIISFCQNGKFRWDKCFKKVWKLCKIFHVLKIYLGTPWHWRALHVWSRVLFLSSFEQN